MKIIKRISLILLLFTLTITASVTTVSAFAVGEEFTSFSKRTASLSPAVKLNSYSYGKSIYTAVYAGDNVRYDVFCMDPGRATPSKLYISRLLLAQEGIKDKDYGLATIITTQPEDGDYQTTGDQFVFAKGIALRIFLDGYAGWSSSASNATAISALRTLARDLRNNTTSSAISGPASVIHDAAILYQTGVRAAESYTPSKSLSIETQLIEIADEEETDESTEEESSNSFTFGGGNSGSTENSGPIIKDVTKRNVLKVTLKNFDSEGGTFTFDGFEGGSAGTFSTTIVGMSTENSDDFTTYTTPLSYGTNVFDTFSDAVETAADGTKSLTFYIAIETTGTVEITVTDGTCENQDCENVNGKLKYTYTDPKVLTGAVLYNNLSGVSGAQRFLVAARTQNTNSESIDIPVTACNECREDTCEPVKCKGEDCEYDATLPQICEDDAEVDENGLVEYKFLEAYTEEGYNIVKCILGGKKDAAENTYKLVDEDNAKMVSDNPYCSILCKEDYSIKVPYKQIVDEGRYFKITFSMRGQQDCYSTKFDEEQFNKDIIAKEKEIIDALNKWSVYYELVNKDPNTLVKTPGNIQSCNKAECEPSTLSSDGCSKTSTTQGPSNDPSGEWYVQIGTMVWGQNPNVHYYDIDMNSGAITTTAEPQEYPDDALEEYGYIKDQTYNSATCNFSDNNTSHSVNGMYSQVTTINGVSLKFMVSGSKIFWKLENSGNEDPVRATSYVVRGYDRSGKLLFQKRLTVSAGADYDATGNFEANSSVATVKLASASDPYRNVSCSASQTPCEKVEASEHFEEMLPTYQSDLEEAKEKVEDLVEELKEIVDLYNSCVGDKEYESFSETYESLAYWNMIYKYDPEIKYSYDEPDPTDSSRNKWIDEVSSLNCEDKSCDYMFSKNEEIFAEDCAEEGSVTCNSLGADGTFKSVFFESLNEGADESAPDDSYVNTYCIGDVNADYSCKDTTLHTLDDSAYEDKPFFVCNFDGDKFDCTQETHPLTKVNYIHKAALAKGDYDTRLVYYTGHQKGDIKIEYTDQPILNYSQVQGLPVSADTPQGTYIYILNIENVGTFYDSGELGRIYSSNPKSLSTYSRGFQNSPTATYPITTGSGADAVDIHKEIAVNEYACTYKVSQSSCVDSEGNTHTMDECDIGGEDADWASCQERLCPSGDGGNYCVKEAESYYVCTGTSYDKDSCRKVGSRDEALSQAANNYNCCPECEVVCVGKCLYVVAHDEPNDGKVQYEFRTVSPQNMNPNSRKLGYNWDSNNPSNSLAAQKAANTISEIEARAGAGENPSINIEDISDYQLKVVMTPDMVTWIKEYNNEQATQGAYNNDSLTCYNYDLDGYNEDQCKASGYIWQEEKCVMSNVFCYSTFIDSLEENFADQVDAPHRSEAKNSAYDNFRTYVGVTNGAQSIITNDYWTIYKYDNLDINGDGIPDIGPSWK